MARILRQTLIRESQGLIREPSSSSSSSSHSHILLSGIKKRWALLLRPGGNIRRRSNRSEKAQLVEVELEAAEAAGGELGMRRLEDAIHGIIVRRSAPDWLPFVPGSSYWVPPRKTHYGLVELVGKLAIPMMTEEETMSFTSVRGWPSSSFFIQGVSPHRVKKMPVNTIVQSDDDEA